MGIRKIGVIVSIFVFSTVLSFAESKGVAYYYEKLSSHKKVGEIGQVSYKNDVVTIKGMIYDRMRVDTFHIKDDGINDGDAEIVLLVRDIEQSFLDKNDDIYKIKVTTTDNSIIAKGRAKLLGKKFNVKVEGFFNVSGGDLNCTLKNAKLGFLRMPKWIVKKFNKKFNPFFSFEDLGMRITATKMEFKKDRIIIK